MKKLLIAAILFLSVAQLKSEINEVTINDAKSKQLFTIDGKLYDASLAEGSFKSMGSITVGKIGNKTLVLRPTTLIGGQGGTRQLIGADTV